MGFKEENSQDLIHQKAQRFIEFKSASTPMESQKPLLKDEDGKEVDVHMYSQSKGFSSSCYEKDFRKPKRKDTWVPQPSGPTKSVADEAVHKELGDSLVRAATTASSLEADQDSGGGPRCQEAIGDTTAQIRLELNELMDLSTKLQTRVLELEKTKTTQQNEIDSWKRRVKKLEKRNSTGTKTGIGHSKIM
nr:hypothetical protein [Tanacetum cinerariifolium]